MTNVRNLYKTTQSKVRRGIEKNNPPIVRALNHLRFQTLGLMKSDVANKGVCTNVTLVSKKGERKPLGKSGPREYNGNIGKKGEIEAFLVLRD